MKYFEIDGFLPFYTEDGHDQTCILLKNGDKEYSPYAIKHFIPHLLFDTGLDVRSTRLWATKITGLKQNLPLVIDDQNIFIPIKFRKPLKSTTTAFGYINYTSIATYSDMRITLNNQNILETLSSAKYIDKKLIDAKLLAYAYLDTRKQYEFMWKSF